jgi:hypothetical protein
MAADVLHRNITNDERLAAISSYRLPDIVSAPGHKHLRSPETARAIAQQFKQGETLMADEPILLNVHTRSTDGHVEILSVQCQDGNHRVVASVLAGAETVSCLSNKLDTSSRPRKRLRHERPPAPPVGPLRYRERDHHSALRGA